MNRFTSRLKIDFVDFKKLYTLNKYIGPSSNLPLADCMSFSCEFNTLRSGKLYDLRTQPKMSKHGDENTGEAETGITQGRRRVALDSLQS